MSNNPYKYPGFVVGDVIHSHGFSRKIISVTPTEYEIIDPNAPSCPWFVQKSSLEDGKWEKW